MKKFILFCFIILMLTGCKTQEQLEQEKKEEEINKVTEEVNKQELPEETKKWLIDTRTASVTTILCVKTSKKCEDLKEFVDNLLNENDIIIYFYYLDEMDEDIKSVIKSTYELKDYANYTPYIFIVDNEKLLTTKTDINTDDLKSLINEYILKDQEN